MSPFRWSRFVALVLVLPLTACVDDSAVPESLLEPVPEEAIIVSPVDSAQALAVGWGHACALDTLGAAWCWGRNDFGQLGRASTQLCGGNPCSWKPLRVTGGHVFRQLAAGGLHTCGVEEGTLQIWCWGYGEYGQRGNGGQANGSVPVHADAGVEFASVAAGQIHTCGLSTNGRVFCWGGNHLGAVGGPGAELTSYVTMPRVVPGVRTYRMLAASNRHSCAIATSDGAVWCWGYGFHGQLGDSSAMVNPWTAREPVRASAGPGYVWITAGVSHTCALRANGAAWCWGDNYYGQLGNASGGGPSRTTPATATRFRQLHGGNEHTCGLALDGRLWCWGTSERGEIGVDSIAETLPQSRLRGSRVYDGLAAGGFSFDGGLTCATSAGSVYCWGGNAMGGTGRDPSTSPVCTYDDPCQPTPVRVPTAVRFRSSL